MFYQQPLTILIHVVQLDLHLQHAIQPQIMRAAQILNVVLLEELQSQLEALSHLTLMSAIQKPILICGHSMLYQHQLQISHMLETAYSYHLQIPMQRF